MELKEYFEKELYNKIALKTFFKNTNKKENWKICNKIKIYNNSHEAFFLGNSIEKNFKDIYQELKFKWSVFRPYQAKSMKSEDLIKILTNIPEQYSQKGNISILEIDINDEDELKNTIKSLKNIKPINAEIPEMAISKFLHFYNPKLFPIIDNEIIKNGALVTFRKEWKEFNDSNFNTVDHYYNYIRLASFYIEKLNHTNTFNSIINDINEYYDIKLNDYWNKNYTTFFDFILIGAHFIEYS